MCAILSRELGGGNAHNTSILKSEKMAHSLIEGFEFDSTVSRKKLEELEKVTAKVISASMESSTIKNLDDQQEFFNQNIFPKMREIHSLIGKETPRLMEEIDRKLFKIQK